MAEKKKSSSKSTSKSSSGGAIWGLNKISMYIIIVVALLYVITTILSFIPLDLALSYKIIGIINGFATAAMITVVSILAWRYVAHKNATWQVIYIICLILVFTGVVIPLIV